MRPSVRVWIPLLSHWIHSQWQIYKYMQDGIRREVQTMSLIDHPNLLRAHCSFTAGHNLWVVMPYMAGGSCLHIMKSSYPEGFDEPVIATLLREVLKALVYLHAHGHIHRDVKVLCYVSTNILLFFKRYVPFWYWILRIWQLEFLIIN